MARAILLGIVIALTAFARAQLANSPPSPMWIAGEPGKAATVEKQFEHSGKLLKAILFVAVEKRASVLVNGTVVGEAEPNAKAVTYDVTAHIRAGTNVVVLRSEAPVAVLLELNGDLAARRWLASDASWTATGGQLTVRGSSDSDPAANPFDLRKTFDAYNSWQLAKSDQQNAATDPATFTALPDFATELIRSATADEGSWVAMAFDPEGRLTLAREKKGLLRVTLRDARVEKIEVINDTLLECRGLLYAHGALYADANNSKGLYILRDTKGDGHFDDARELLHTEGGVGHGRNHIRLAPDGRIYIAHGNNVLLPQNLTSRSPLRNYAHDQLLPNPWDGSMFDGNVELPAGHILRMNPDGTEVELLAGGLRNPLDIAFNRDGELFTFDADMERDVGTPWYMPTRVLHIVPGADYGWRRGTGRFPASYADTLPSVVDIGLSSPTGIFFGYGAKFPAKYQDALFLCDWSYGRIIAVHLAEKGASYSGTQETFLAGRPMNVTDGCIGPDGAMWFITGGRGTQSGLYRVAFTGKGGSVEASRSAGTIPPARIQRRELERLQSKPDLTDAEVKLIVAALGSDDRFLAHAARVALESLPAGKWRLASLGGDAWLQGALAAIHTDRKDLRDEILPGLKRRLAAGPDPASLRVLQLAFTRLGAPDAAEGREWLALLDPAFPGPRGESINRELCKLLILLKSPGVIAKSAALLRNAEASETLVHYPLFLRTVKEGWTLESRRAVFDALNRAEKMNGASTFFKVIQDIRAEIAASLTAEEARELATVILPRQPVRLSPHAMPGHTFRNWKMEDVVPVLDRVSSGRSFEGAKTALISTQCVVCHRVSADASLPAGVIGPDLSQVSSRFNRRDLLDQILNPSKIIDEKFRNLTVTLTTGKQVTGSVESEDDERLVLRPSMVSDERAEVAKSMITARAASDISPMPAGLLSPLKLDQILDILAWFEAGGDPKHKVFR